MLPGIFKLMATNTAVFCICNTERRGGIRHWLHIFLAFHMTYN